MAGIIRGMEDIKVSTEIMSAGRMRTSDENTGDNTDWSGSIGNAKRALPLGLPLVIRLHSRLIGGNI